MTILDINWTILDIIGSYNLRCFNFQALGPEFVLALEPIDGSFFGIRHYIYVLNGGYKETLQKVAITVILGAKTFLGELDLRLLIINKTAVDLK